MPKLLPSLSVIKTLKMHQNLVLSPEPKSLCGNDRKSKAHILLYSESKNVQYEHRAVPHNKNRARIFITV